MSMLLLIVVSIIISCNALYVSSNNRIDTKLFSKGFGSKPITDSGNVPAVEAIKLTRKTDTRQVMV